MATTKAFVTGTVGFPAGTTALDTRKADAALLVPDNVTTQAPRTGVLTENPSIVTSDASTAPMRVAVAKAGFATSRGVADGVNKWTNDGSIFVTVTKPVSNSHIVVVYAKANDNAAGDANSLPVIEVVTGAAAASPAKPAIPTGAEELATLTIPSTATSTQSSGVVLTNTYKMTAMRGGVVPFRTKADLNLWTTAGDMQLARVVGDTRLYRSAAGVWKNADTGLNLVKPASVTNGAIVGEGAVTFAGVTSAAPLILDGIFSGDYDHYLVQLDITAASAGGNPAMRMRTGGVTDSAANYHYELAIASNASMTAAGAGAANQWLLSGALGVYHATSIELHNPAVAAIRTMGVVNDSSDDGVTHGRSSAEIWHGNAVAHDGFAIYPSVGGANFTGKIRVYGYYNG